MKKGETIQKLVLFGAMAVGAVLVAEGYLQARAFVSRVEKADRQIALLKQDVDALRVQFEVTPRGGAQTAPVLAGVSPPVSLPIPEPMQLPVPAPERQRKPAHAKDQVQNGADESSKEDSVPDDGKIVLMKEPKVSPAPAASPTAASTVDVKLLVKK